MAGVDVDRLVASLLAWQGVPWHHQGRARTGVDCVGLGVAVLAEQGVHVQAPAAYAPGAGPALLLQGLDGLGLLQRAPLADPLQPGDVLALRIRRDPQHLAIAVAPDRMVHATLGVGVCAVTLSPLWRARLVGRWTWRP